MQPTTPWRNRPSPCPLPAKRAARASAIVVLAALLLPAAAWAQSIDIRRAATGGWDVQFAGALSLDGRKIADGSGTHFNPLAPGVHKLEAAGQRVLLREPKSKLAAAPPLVPKTIDIAIADNKAAVSGTAVLPNTTVRVTQGELVRLNFTADAAMTVHFHGYDIEAALAPDAPASLVFDAELAGRFPVEKHGGREVRLLFVEVYPK